jgi:hypothetical protein
MARLYPNTIYKIANARYFGGRLPHIRVRWTTDEELHGALGCTVLHPAEEKMAVFLNSKYKKEDKIWGFTLLHEMAHVEQFCTHPRSEPHGRVWIRIMKRLAREGAFNSFW